MKNMKNRKRQINIKGINQDIYELSQQIPQSNKKIYLKGIQYYLNIDLEQITLRDKLKKELANKKTELSLNELQRNQIQQGIKNINNKLTEINNKISKNKNIPNTKTTVQKYNLNKKQKRALVVLNEAQQKFGLTTEDFLIIKKDYVNRVALVNDISFTELVKLFKEQS